MASQMKTIPGGSSFLGEVPSEGSLFASILPYVLMIIFMPIATFFASKKAIFEDILGYSETSANVYSAVSAIILLHVLLAAFVYKAYSEALPKGGKQD